MERFRTWHEVLMERLSNPEDVTGYLEVSLEEYLEDGDKAFFLKGIKKCSRSTRWDSQRFRTSWH